MSGNAQRIADLVEIQQLCARYMAFAAEFVLDRWLEVFTPDVEYSAFGTPYTLERFPDLLAAAPRGQFIGNMPVVEFGGDDVATGVQHFVFIDQTTHAMRLGWYKDEYRRTADGWRFVERVFHPLYRGPVDLPGRVFAPPGPAADPACEPA